MRVPTINALACSQLDCALTDTQLTELFGRGSKEGLLHWVKDGTVLLNNVDKVRA
jgi:transcriptional regulator with AAA-type ATPase domain